MVLSYIRKHPYILESYIHVLGVNPHVCNFLKIKLVKENPCDKCMKKIIIPVSIFLYTQKFS